MCCPSILTLAIESTWSPRPQHATWHSTQHATCQSTQHATWSMQHNGPRNKVVRNPQDATRKMQPATCNVRRTTCDVQRAMRRDVASAPLSMPMRRSVAASARMRAARGNKCNVAALQRRACHVEEGLELLVHRRVAFCVGRCELLEQLLVLRRCNRKENVATDNVAIDNVATDNDATDNMRALRVTDREELAQVSELCEERALFRILGRKLPVDLLQHATITRQRNTQL